MHHGVIFNFGMFETYFSCDKDIWNAVTDFYMYFFIVIFSFTAILQLILISSLLILLSSCY